MERQAVINEDGTWVTNTAQFPFIDPETSVRFEPGVRTKVKITDWLIQQTVMEYEGKDKDLAAYEAAKAKIEADKQLAEAVLRAKRADADAKAAEKIAEKQTAEKK